MEDGGGEEGRRGGSPELEGRKGKGKGGEEGRRGQGYQAKQSTCKSWLFALTTGCERGGFVGPQMKQTHANTHTMFHVFYPWKALWGVDIVIATKRYLHRSNVA